MKIIRSIVHPAGTAAALREFIRMWGKRAAICSADSRSAE
jgi:hypothetical protein